MAVEVRMMKMMTSHLFWKPVYISQYLGAHQPDHTGERSAQDFFSSCFVIVASFLLRFLPYIFMARGVQQSFSVVDGP